MNYPTEKYESYADCDDHFVRRSLPPGLRPFWAVDNISEATNYASFEMSQVSRAELCKYILNVQESEIHFYFADANSLMAYAIKPLLKVSEAPYQGYFLPFAMS